MKTSAMIQKFVLAAILVLILSACAKISREPEILDPAPEWYQAYEDTDNYFYGYGSGHSMCLNRASEYARHEARLDVGESLQSMLEAMIEEASRQSTDGPELQGRIDSASRRLIDITVAGVAPDKADRVREQDKSYRVYMRLRVSNSEGGRVAREILENMDLQIEERRNFNLTE